MVRTSLVVLAVALGALVVVYRADAQVQRTAAYRTTAKPTITGSHAQRSHANARRSSGRGPGSGVYGSSGGAGCRGTASSPSITPASGSTTCSRSRSLTAGK